MKAPVSQEKITNASKNSTQVVLSIKDNMQCKEGIFNDFLHEKLKRNKEKTKHLATNSANDRYQNCRALLPSSFIREIKEDLGWVPYQRECTRS